MTIGKTHPESQVNMKDKLEDDNLLQVLIGDLYGDASPESDAEEC